MDAILKSVLFGLVFITMLILSSSILNAEEEKEEELKNATIELKGEKRHIAYTYSDWADYPSELLVG